MALAIKRTGLVIDRVDLVDQGANPDAHILLYKRKEGDKMTFEDFVKNLTEEEQALINAEIEKAKESEEKPEEDNSEEIDNLNKRIKELEDELAKANEVDEEDVDDSEEDIFKSLPEALRKRFEDLEKRAKELEEEKLMKAFEEKAENYENLPVKKERLAEMLREISETSKETYEDVLALFEASNNAFGKHFEEEGSGLDNEAEDKGNAYEQLESLAKEKAETENISFAKAFDKVLVENYDLYKQYIAEVK